MGGTSYPSPIAYATHYAQWFSELILERDEKFEDLELNNLNPAQAAILSHRPSIVFHRQS